MDAPIPDTRRGRWYPTAVTLPDGGVLVSFGTDEDGNLNDTQQVWKDGQWTDIVNFVDPPLYPRMHVVSDGRVFMSGPLMLTQFLDTSSRTKRQGKWTPAVGPRRQNPGIRPFGACTTRTRSCTSAAGIRRTRRVETIDLNEPTPRWKSTDDMHFARRQHNATLLPDGTVAGHGGDPRGTGFNNLTPGQPIRSAELWDPKTGHWTKLAKASVDRCYHSVAVLLPDATVLSAGGGEFRPNNYCR